LSDLREAFDNQEKRGRADYIRMGEFEAATRIIAATNRGEGGNTGYEYS